MGGHGGWYTCQGLHQYRTATERFLEHPDLTRYGIMVERLRVEQVYRRTPSWNIFVQ